MPRLTTLKPRIATLDTRTARAGATQRIRGRKLQRIRERYLRAHPLCKRCAEIGIVRPATDVDHIVALVNGGAEDEFDDSNRQGLCTDCHQAKTNEDLGRAEGAQNGPG